MREVCDYDLTNERRKNFERAYLHIELYFHLELLRQVVYVLHVFKIVILGRVSIEDLNFVLKTLLQGL